MSNHAITITMPGKGVHSFDSGDRRQDLADAISALTEAEVALHTDIEKAFTDAFYLCTASGSDDLEIDGNARVSLFRDGLGAFVQCWAWIEAADADLWVCGFCDNVAIAAEDNICPACGEVSEC